MSVYQERTTLNQLYRLIQKQMATKVPAAAQAEPVYCDFSAGLDKAAGWYIGRLGA